MRKMMYSLIEFLLALAYFFWPVISVAIVMAVWVVIIKSDLPDWLKLALLR